MFDLEKNQIQLAETPNSHILVWGRSGQGKTYCLCRKMEKVYEEGGNIFVVDFSGSYTERELQKNCFKYTEKKTRIFDLAESPFFCSLHFEISRTQKEISDSLIAVLHIESYRQKKILQKAVELVFEIKKYLQLPVLVKVLESMLEWEKEMDGDRDNQNNIMNLLARLYPFADIVNLFVGCEESYKKRLAAPIRIIQLSGFPEQQRRFLTEFITTILWKEIMGNPEHLYNVLLLDEFQFMSVKAGSALSGLLREGRKHGVAVILSTQFISAYSREEQETLLQAGNILIFRPNDRDMRFSAQIIESEKTEQWKKILHNLKVGEAVLKGNYRINGKNKMMSQPVICRI